MQTARVPVIFGYGPNGCPGGVVRVVVPHRIKPSTFGSRVASGTIAVHGPSSSGDAIRGVGYRLLSPAGDGAWSVDGWVDVIIEDDDDDEGE